MSNQISIRAELETLRKAIAACKSKTLAGSQVARRIVGICKKPISDYDLFDVYMESFGRLSFFDPMQKRNLRVTILALQKEGLLELKEEKYIASKDAIADADRFVEFDLKPEMVMDILEGKGPALVSAVVLAFSCSTSTSCKCTSSSSSSAASSDVSSRSGSAELGTVMCASQVL